MSEMTRDGRAQGKVSRHGHAEQHREDGSVIDREPSIDWSGVKTLSRVEDAVLLKRRARACGVFVLPHVGHQLPYCWKLSKEPGGPLRNAARDAYEVVINLAASRQPALGKATLGS